MHMHRDEISGFATFEKFVIKLGKNKNIIVETNRVRKILFLKLIALTLSLNYLQLRDYIN